MHAKIFIVHKCLFPSGGGCWPGAQSNPLYNRCISSAAPSGAGRREKRVPTIYTPGISTYLHIYTSTHPHTGHTDNDATHSFPHIISSVQHIVTTLLVIYSANMISTSLPGKNCRWIILYLNSQRIEKAWVRIEHPASPRKTQQC